MAKGEIAQCFQKFSAAEASKNVNKWTKDKLVKIEKDIGILFFSQNDFNPFSQTETGDDFKDIMANL